VTRKVLGYSPHTRKVIEANFFVALGRKFVEFEIEFPRAVVFYVI
jgi:hypothetical protein